VGTWIGFALEVAAIGGVLIALSRAAAVAPGLIWCVLIHSVMIATGVMVLRRVTTSEVVPSAA